MSTLFEMANSWLGVPFRWHGRDRKGCDCIGLIIGILYENKYLSQSSFNHINTIKYGTNLAKINQLEIMQLLTIYFTQTSRLDTSDLLLIRSKASPFHFIIHEREKKAKHNKIIHITQELGHVFQTNFNDSFNVIANFQLK